MAKSFKPKVTCGLAISEMMAIEMFYHLKGSKCFKYYYKYFVEVHLKEYFPGLPCYNRFVQLKPRLLVYLFCFIIACRPGTMTRTYYADSSKLVVCHNLTLGVKLCKGLCGKLFGDKGYIS